MANETDINEFKARPSWCFSICTRTTVSQQLCPPDLPTLLERAKTAQKNALNALVALAEALPKQNSSSITDKLDKAKAEQKQAEAVLEELKVANNAVVGPAEARGTLGDEDDEELRRNANKAEKEAERLEEEKEWAQQYQKWLRAGHGLALGLLALCGVLLSLDSVRTALGVTKDNQLLVALGVVAVSCQVAAQALGTSRRHLGDTANDNRAMARRLRNRAQQVKGARDNAEAAKDTRGKIANAKAPLERVTKDLKGLVDAVDQDMVEGVPQEGHEFRKAEQFLEDMLVTPAEQYRNVTQRLQNAHMVLRRQRVPSEYRVLRASPECPLSVPEAMELQKLSKSLLESLVTVVASLGKVVATVARSEGDVLFVGSSGSLSKALNPFIDHLRDTLSQAHHNSLGKALAKLRATPGAAWDSATSAASAWWDSVTEVVNEWNNLVSEANALLDACNNAATAEGGIAADAAKRARDLQEKVKNWQKSRADLVNKTWDLPWVTDKKKAPTASEEYEAKMETAAQAARTAIKELEDCLKADSENKAAIKRGKRAAVALGPLGGLVAACTTAMVMFQELRCTVGDIKASLEGTKQPTPNIPEDLVAKVTQAEWLWETSPRPFTRHLNGIVEDIEKLLANGIDDPDGKKVAEKCQEAMADISKLLQGQ
ncbi:uncharacterized protein LOC117009771 [Catharus ustulatus]|uniref:uncharacterized protein LOC117009771 n=1 Tax=Catharus ustulatus TaxID=91951 RepID=UPI00140A678B|nr:uncharacterized protein LOC117009771 [Catharus ustulatus]